jgi:acyl-CoA thioesterase-2
VPAEEEQGKEQGGAMPSIKEAAAAFLANQRVAVSGVSRNPKSHGSNLIYQRLRARGLDHAVWFHEPFRADDWLLYFQESPAASGAHGLARGQVLRRNGRLVASVVQEGLIWVSSPE